MIFLRGIGGNWLVSMGCYFALQCRDLSLKLMGIWWPIFGFVSLGFDHVVANMTLIPMAIFLGAPEISVGLYIWKGIIPTLIGNIVGGALFCSVYFWYMHLMDVETLPFFKQKQDESYSEDQSETPRKDDVEARAGMVSATA